LGIIASSCLGSIAAMMILADGNTLFHVVHLSWIVIICMIYNAAVLVGFKPKMAFLIQVISVLSSLFTIAYYIFF
jgi:transcription elongation factor GreA-like protein